MKLSRCRGAMAAAGAETVRADAIAGRLFVV
jgi:hypothetical protein